MAPDLSTFSGLCCPPRECQERVVEMEEKGDGSATSAVSEALGGHGLGRQRKIPVLQPRTALQQRPAVASGGGPPLPSGGFGPAPFVSPRMQQQLVAGPHANAAVNVRSGVTKISVQGVSRSGPRSPPRHTAVTIDDVPVSEGPARVNGSNAVGHGVAPTSPLRFRGPPLIIDSSPGPHRNHPAPGSSNVSGLSSPSRGAEVAIPTGGRRRTSSSAASSHIPSALRSPKRGQGAAGGQRLAMASALPPPAAILSSMFLRRKPPQKPPSPIHEPGVNLVSPGSSHQVLFFQDADSETSSQRARSTNGDSVNGGRPLDTSDSTRSTDDSSGKDEHGGHVSDGTHPTRSASFKEHRKRQTSHAQPTGIEKLGELSREEEAYDFAILLKSSKFEEHLEIAIPAATAIADDADSSKAPLHRAVSDVHSVATSANIAVEEATDNTGAAGGGDVTSPVTFKLAGSPRSQLRKQKNDPASARTAIIDRITHTGLQVKRLLSLDGRQTLLKVKAPQLVLEMGAERMKLRKLRKFDQIWMEFSCEVRETFADFDAKLGGVKFIDSEKQCIVHSLLTTDVSQGGAGLNEYCPLKSKYVLKMFPLHKHEDLMSLRKHWVTYWRSTGDGDAPSSSSCGYRAKRLTTHALHQPIDQVAQYYGERVAYYFAWMEMYTRWLITPSIGGVLLFILQVQSKTLDHPLASPYAIFIALWTSAFLIAWKRRAASLAYRWGTLGYEDAEITRPEFYGDPSVSTETIKKYPAWKRYVKYAITVPTVITSIVLVLVLTIYAFSVRDRLEAQSIAVKAKAKNLAKDIASDLQHGLTLENFRRLGDLGMDWDFWFYFLITPILYGLLIPVLDYAFTKYARRMTNWENHQTETHYQSHLILKVFSFRFVHVFASLYYYAFTNSSNASNSLLRVAVQLASFMITDQLWRNSMQTLYPFVMRRVQVQRKKKATNAQFHQSTVFNGGAGAGYRLRGRQRSRHGSALYHNTNGGAAGGGGYHLPTNSNAVIHEQCVRLEQASDHAWEEAELEQYDTFEDYTEMLIQFGYVTFFSLAFPLAPLLALVNNLFELRMDAFKLCHAKQRPLAQKASGIGIWFHVLQLMSVLAVLTNCLHIAFTTTLIERLYPGVTSTHKVWVVFCVEHAILALKLWMMVVIPSMPSEVKENVRREREHAKIESARAMAAKIQSQQEQLRIQEQELLAKHREQKLLQVKLNDDAQSRNAEGVRRRSRTSSSEAGGLRAAQAVLET